MRTQEDTDFNCLGEIREKQNKLPCIWQCPRVKACVKIAVAKDPQEWFARDDNEYA